MSVSSIRTHLAVGVNHPLGPLVTRDEPTPTPGPRQLLVRLLKLGFTPLSLWQVDFGLLVPEGGMVLGGNLVGKVVELGKELESEGEVKIGSLVMAFQFSSTAKKPAQELVLVDQDTFSLVPENISLDEAATIPDSFVTAYHSLATELGVPLPTSLPASAPPREPSLPVLVWGGGTTCGQFAIQLLHAAGYVNISVTASPSRFAKLSALGAAHVYSYSEPLPNTETFSVVLDCVGDADLTVAPISRLSLAANAKVGVLLPVRIGGYGSTTAVTMDVADIFPQGVEVKGVRTHFYQANPLVGRILQRKIMHDAVAAGIIKPTAFRLVEGSTFLERCENALDEVRRGSVRGEKLVVDA